MHVGLRPSGSDDSVSHLPDFQFFLHAFFSQRSDQRASQRPGTNQYWLRRTGSIGGISSCTSLEKDMKHRSSLSANPRMRPVLTAIMPAEISARAWRRF
jgi:hypothetical protein